MARVVNTLRGVLLASVVGVGASGCQLIADFDRSKIPSDAGQPPDASLDAGADAQVLDAALDGAPPFDSGSDAALDAGHDAGTDDAGTDDAGTDDAG